MRAFESQGLWHLPDNPKDFVAGTLTYSEDEGLILKLTGVLREARGLLAEAANYPVIHGFIRDSPYGRLVTLVDCFQRRSTITIPGFASEEVRANRAYIGGYHLTTEAEAVFESSRARYSSIGEWSRLSGMGELVQTRDETRRTSVQYRDPEPLRFGVNDRSVRIEAGTAFSHSDREFSIKEQPYVAIERLQISAIETLRAFIHPLQDFLTFASDRATALDEIAFFATSETPREPMYLVFQPIYRQDPESRGVSYADMLFTWPDVAQSHSDILETWFRFRREFQPACDVFFGLQYAPPAYGEMRFLLMTTALGLMLSQHTSSSPLHPAIARLRRDLTIDKDRRWLDLLLIESELSLPWTAFALAQEHAQLFNPVLGDIEAFITQVVDTRRHLFHREAVHQPDPDRGLRLWKLTERTMLFIKVAILDALGFSPDETARLVSRSRRYTSLLE